MNLQEMKNFLQEDIYKRDKTFIEIDDNFRDILESCIDENGITDKKTFIKSLSRITTLINSKFNLSLRLKINPISKQKSPTRFMYGKLTTDDFKRASSEIKEIYLGDKTGFHYIKLTRLNIVIEEAGLVYLKYPERFTGNSFKFKPETLTALLLGAIGDFVFLPFSLDRSKKDPDIFKLEINGQGPITINTKDKTLEENVRNTLSILLASIVITLPLLIPSVILYMSSIATNQEIQSNKDSLSLPIMYGYSKEILELYNYMKDNDKKTIGRKIWNFFALKNNSEFELFYNDIIKKIETESKNSNNTTSQRNSLKSILKEIER